jgi:hypothetical protein
MTVNKRNASAVLVKELLADDRDLMKTLLKEALQEVLEGPLCQDSCRMR